MAESCPCTRPVRLQLSRRKGFNLQAASRAFNGRAAVKVARPSVWGNPYRIAPAIEAGGVYCPEITAESAVALYRERWEKMLVTWPESSRRTLAELAGFNLACWCALDQPCHADVLLELANG